MNTTPSPTELASSAIVRPLGDSEVSRIEPNLPPCPRCGAPAEMRTASWTWIDYITCSKRCGCTTYEIEALREGGRLCGKTLAEAGEANMALWLSWTNGEDSAKQP